MDLRASGSSMRNTEDHAHSTPFVPGKTRIPVGRAYYEEGEIKAVVDTLQNGWLGLSKKGREFEHKFTEYIGNGHTVFVNSGSSANYLALEAIKQSFDIHGGEIITPALTFPTTVNPIIQHGFLPVFIDIDDTLNLSPKAVEKAVTSKTRGIIFPHILGNPAKIDEIMDIAKTHNVFVLEDCCSCLGSKYKGRILGSFGNASTFSFHAAHSITTGEGGAVVTADKTIEEIVRKKRDWGKDCVCTEHYPDSLGECGNRFSYNLDGMRYDHRYVYSEIGYNMKPLELQAAFGCVQLKRLEYFNSIRKKNFNCYVQQLKPLSHLFTLPNILPGSEPVFMGLPLIINDDRIDREDIVLFLLSRKIDARYMFAGNITKQPAYQSCTWRISGGLEITDTIAANGFWVGIHPGVTEEMIEYIVNSLKEYCSGKGLL